MDKGSGSDIFPDPDPGDPKRPYPTRSGSGSATLQNRDNTIFKVFFAVFTNKNSSVYINDVSGC